ncbi:hypothetical protein FQR65_LT17244 [Abscondita terminalis]|nr:hypothetical protein FQR65_LT17244 [Abscondita terminalis]
MGGQFPHPRGMPARNRQACEIRVHHLATDDGCAADDRHHTPGRMRKMGCVGRAPRPIARPAGTRPSKPQKAASGKARGPIVPSVLDRTGIADDQVYRSSPGNATLGTAVRIPHPSALMRTAAHRRDELQPHWVFGCCCLAPPVSILFRIGNTNKRRGDKACPNNSTDPTRRGARASLTFHAHFMHPDCSMPACAPTAPRRLRQDALPPDCPPCRSCSPSAAGGRHGRARHGPASDFRLRRIIGRAWAEPAEELRLTRLINDTAAEWVSRHPDRFIGSFALPLGDMDMALAETERCLSMGLRVANLSSNHRGRYLGESRYEALWAEFLRHDVVTFIHPDGGARFPGYQGTIAGCGTRSANRSRKSG